MRLNKYQIIFSKTQLSDLINKLQKSSVFAFSIKTNVSNNINADIVGFSFAIESDIAAYLPVAHNYLGVPNQLNCEFVLSLLKPVLENEKIFKIGQNLKYDHSILQNHGIKLHGVAFDIMLESYVLNNIAEYHHDIHSLSEEWLNYKIVTFKEVVGKYKGHLNFSQVTIEKASIYAIESVNAILCLHLQMWSKLQKYTRTLNIFQNIEMPLIPVLSRIEYNGVKIDPAILNRYSKYIDLRMHKLEQKAYNIVGESFNLFSTKQLQMFLFQKQGIKPLQKTPGGLPSTSEEVLKELSLNYELPRVILEYRKLAKLKCTYTDRLPMMISPKTGRVHTSYNQTITTTGRLSSTHPNLQNIPVRNKKDGLNIREAFVASKDYFLMSADYSQIELRVMAHLSQDKELLTAFIKGKDIHCITASEIFGTLVNEVTDEQRHSAKVINFGLIYGMSAFGLSRQLNISFRESRQYIDIYFKRYPNILKYIKLIQEQAKKRGYVETLSGRRLYISNIKSTNSIYRASAERAAINAPIQGTAADIIKYAMIGIDSWLMKNKPRVKMIMQIHDELVFEVHKKEDIKEVTSHIHQLMQNIYILDVPLLVEIKIGDNLGSLESI